MDPPPAITIIEHFSLLSDPRVDRTKAHRLTDILTLAICAIISRADTWVAMERFGKAKYDGFKSFLPLPNGVPSHDTFGRVFAALDPTAFSECFSAWACSNHLLLGQIKTDEKSNEITAIPQRLKRLHLQGCIVTIDAMDCQKAIIDQGADYVLALKANHATFF